MSKREKYFKSFILVLTIFSALGLIFSAAYFSVTGLSKTFAGASSEVLIMGSALEFSKVVISMYVHFFWEKMKGVLKYWLLFSLLVLIIITSMGIYGFLSNAFKETEAQFNASNRKIELIEFKKQNFEKRIEQYQTQVDQYNSQITTLNSNRSSINLALESSSDFYEYIDQESGEKLRRPVSSANRKDLINQISSIDVQVADLQDRVTAQYDKIEVQRDSILNLDEYILEVEMNNEAGSELGPLIYVSELTNKPVSVIVNIFILILVLVFDPLAVSLVFAASYAFSYRSKSDDSEVVSVDSTPLDTTVDSPIEPQEKPTKTYYIKDSDKDKIIAYYKNVLLPTYNETPEGRAKKPRKPKTKVEARPEVSVSTEPVKTEDAVETPKVEEPPKENAIRGKKK